MAKPRWERGRPVRNPWPSARGLSPFARGTTGGVLRTNVDPLPQKNAAPPWKKGTNVETPGRARRPRSQGGHVRHTLRVELVCSDNEALVSLRTWEQHGHSNRKAVRLTGKNVQSSDHRVADGRDALLRVRW